MAPAPARHDVNAHFYVRNLDASVGFYVNTLGFEMVRREDSYAIVSLGASVVRLADAKGRGRDGRRGRVASAVKEPLFVPDVENVYRRVRDARVAVIDEMRDPASRVQDFVTVDPDGFPIRLAAAV
ncbi:MAG TPA: VOC family protein [Tepidiformaceae bacterium]|nr:VOC family protein [Tepidiformaceae bacterium]